MDEHNEANGVSLSEDRVGRFKGLIKLLGYAALDAEELDAMDLAEAIDKATNIARRHLEQERG